MILSPSFFEKQWPQVELDGLAQKELDGRKVILPIWHHVTYDDVAKYSPSLVSRIAAKSSDGLDRVVVQLLEAMEIDKVGTQSPRSTKKRFQSKFSGSLLFRLPILIACITLVAVLVFGYIFSNFSSSSTWIRAGDLQIPGLLQGVISLSDDKISLVGGTSRGTDPIPLKTTQIFDPRTSQWSPAGGLNTARFWFGNLVRMNDGRVLIAGGTAKSGYQDYTSSVIFDPVSGSWSRSGDLNTARRNATLALLPDGRVLIAAGAKGIPTIDRFLLSAEIYDPHTAKWKFTDFLPFRAEAQMVVRLRDNRILIVGGDSDHGVSPDTNATFDPVAEKWSKTGPMALGRTGR